MDVREALDQISEIHHHLSKSEVFRGYKPAMLLVIGCLAIGFGLVQYFFLQPFIEEALPIPWLFFAVGIIVLESVNILRHYLSHPGSSQQRLTLRILVQFIPALAAGLCITLVFLLRLGDFAAYLPGIWMLFFGVGVFSMLPYLPSAIYLVGIFYFAIGGLSLSVLPNDLELFPLLMGGAFGFGHILSALVLSRSLKGGGHG